MPQQTEITQFIFGQPLSLCGHLGRLDEAKECLRCLRELHPEPTIGSVMRDVSKGLAPEIAARMVEGLRKAGVAEE